MREDGLNLLTKEVYDRTYCQTHRGEDILSVAVRLSAASGFWRSVLADDRREP